jgi:hypothetical protein
MATLQVYENSQQRARKWLWSATDSFTEKVLLVMQDGRILIVCIITLFHALSLGISKRVAGHFSWLGSEIQHRSI